MAKRTNKPLKTTSQIDRICSTRANRKKIQGSNTWKRLSEWHEQIRDNVRKEINPLEYVSAGFSFGLLQEMELRFNDMVELARYLNHIHYTIDSLSLNIREDKYKTIGQFICEVSESICQLDEKSSLILVPEIIDPIKRKGWKELKTSIKYPIEFINDYDGYDIIMIDYIFMKQDEWDTNLVEVFSMANSFLSYYLMYSSSSETYSLSELMFGIEEEELIDGIKSLVKKPYDEDEDYDDYVLNHISFSLSMMNEKPENILADYIEYGKIVSLIKETEFNILSDLIENKKSVRSIQNMIIKELNKNILSEKNDVVSNLFKVLKKHVLSVPKYALNFNDLGVDINEYADVLSEYRNLRFMLIDSTPAMKLGLISHEERLMQVGIELEADLISKEIEISKEYGKEIKTKVKHYKDNTKFLHAFNRNKKLTEDLFNDINESLKVK